MEPTNQVSSQTVVLRPIQFESETELGFLRDLYSTTRDDIWQAPFPEEQKPLLVSHQFEAQHHHYQNQFADAEFALILLPPDDPIGRIYLNETESEFRIIDLSIIPSHRGQGIGSNLINQVKQRAIQKRKPLRLRVEPHNPALRLYERHGFTVIANEEFNLHMEWNPANKPPANCKPAGEANDA